LNLRDVRVNIVLWVYAIGMRHEDHCGIAR
jgi:hypothetical protein